jgi:peptidoglycan/xylan/chitin deacetylase (PgdA/CDA1 family)
MLNFRNTALAMIVLAVVVLILFLIGLKPGIFPLIFLVAWILLLVLGSVKICMKFYVKAFCKGLTKEKVVSLTFDDGPDPLVTPAVLDILRRHQIKAAFFIIGKKAEKHPEILQKIQAEGHAVGLHSYSHGYFFDLYGRKKMERDLVKAGEIAGAELWEGGKVEKDPSFVGMTGGKSVLFRPPYGVTNPTVAQVVKKLGLSVIGWSVRSLDTTIKDPVNVGQRVNSRLHPGAVVLMHDTRKDLPVILENVIHHALEKGYRFVGLEEMMEGK